MAESSIIKDFIDSQKFPSRNFTLSNEIKIYEVVLTYAEMQALNSSPLTDVIPAPGADYFIQPLGQCCTGYNFNGTDYSTGADITIIYTGGATIYTIASGMFKAGADAVNLDNPSGVDPEINTGITITAATDFTDNGGPVRIMFLYRILPL